MATIINADTSNGLKLTSDTSGELKLQSAGTDIATVNSSGITMASGKGLVGGVTSGTTVASTSGTSIDFTSIPSNVTRVTVMFAGVGTNSTGRPLIQLGDSGGIETSGYISKSAYAGISSAGVNSTAGFIINDSGDPAPKVSGTYVFTLLNSSTNLWVGSGTLCFDGLDLAIMCGGKKTLTGVLDRVRITSVGGTDTFNAGSINILYE